jgi:hypothetical protein
MSFIPDDERLILFDMYNRRMQFVTVDELKQLRDVGMGTALMTTMEWDHFEPKMGEYDFAYLDFRLERIRQSGMRALLPIWQVHNTRFPLAWYAQTPGGSIPEWDRHPEFLLSPWNEDAQGHALEVMQLVKDYVTCDQVQVISSLSRFGESVMPQDARYFDPAAKRSWKAAGFPHDLPDQNMRGADAWIQAAYTRLIINQQRILTDTPWREAWFGFHFPKRGRPNCGVDWFEDYIAAIRAMVPDVKINHITYTYFVPAYDGSYTRLPETVQHMIHDVGTIEWCGAEYCEGLRDGNGERARAIGMRGLVVGPCHAYTNHYQLEPWMVEEIGKAAR